MSYTLSQYHFEPIVKVDDYVKLIPLNRVFKVIYIEPLDLPPKDFGPIPASSPAAPAVIADVQWTELIMPGDELGHFRITPIDDIAITISQPKAAKRFTTKNALSAMGLPTPLDPRLQTREIFVYEDGAPYITIINPMFYPQPTTRVKALGYRYVLEPAVGARVATAIPVAAWVSERR